MDWNKIKAEYIAGGTSYRKLAEKHGVSFNSLKRIAVRDGWNKLREQAEEKATTKIVEIAAEQYVSNMEMVNEVADKLLAKIIVILDRDDDICSQEIKHFTSALKDIKDIKGIRSDIDIEEQRARIDKLRKDASMDEDDNEIIVKMGEEADRYAT